MLIQKLALAGNKDTFDVKWWNRGKWKAGNCWNWPLFRKFKRHAHWHLRWIMYSVGSKYRWCAKLYNIHYAYIYVTQEYASLPSQVSLCIMYTYTCMSVELSSHLVSWVVAADVAFVAHEQCSVYVVTFRVGGMSVSQSLLWLYSLYTITIYSRMVGGSV